MCRTEVIIKGHAVIGCCVCADWIASAWLAQRDEGKQRIRDSNLNKAYMWQSLS